LGVGSVEYGELPVLGLFSQGGGLDVLRHKVGLLHVGKGGGDLYIIPSVGAGTADLPDLVGIVRN